MDNTKGEVLVVEVKEYACGCRFLQGYVHIPRWAAPAVDAHLEKCPEWQEKMGKAVRYRTYAAFEGWNSKHGRGQSESTHSLEVAPPVSLETLDELYGISGPQAAKRWIDDNICPDTLRARCDCRGCIERLGAEAAYWEGRERGDE